MDPRVEPGAYVRRGSRLYEVMSATGSTVTFQNALTDAVLDVDRALVVRERSEFLLVKPAPVAPERVPEELEAA